MNLKNPRIWIGVLSAAAVLWFVSSDIGRTSPGDVTSVHAAVADLEGGQSCSACHGGFFTSMAESCLACHEDVAGHIESGEGLHGVLGKERAQHCAQCHSEHHGPGFSIVNRQSFAMAGSPGPDEFDHAFVGFPMEGKHLELDCTKCHVNADVEVLSEGQHRFLGLDRNCASCHEDPHKGQMQIACAKCHSQTSWDTLGSIGHDDFLPLIGGHAEVSCRKCHAEGSRYALEAFGAGQRPTQRACTNCHRTPHPEPFVRAVGNEQSTPYSESCVLCHEHEHHSFRDDRIEMTSAQHAFTGFPLELPHDVQACDDCHDPSGATFEERFPGRGVDSCAACHEDPHGGQFADGPFAEQGCVACHEREFFEPHAFTLDKHAKTGFSIEGSHAQLECSGCHRDPPAGVARSFHGTPQQCSSCHDDAHRGFFERHLKRSGAAPLAETAHGSCSHCHKTTVFADVDEDQFDHDRWTGFQILGAHAEAACAACHPSNSEPDATGRKFGRVAEHFGVFDGCETCHQDPHRGVFDADGRPLAIHGRSGCARCHVETSFRVFPHGFDHREWTGFPLHGAHGTVGCSACHALQRADELGRTWGAANGNRCEDCHADPHAGQFEEVGRTDCARCHKSTKSFAQLFFDHDRHSRFRLGEAHAKVECAKCHKPERIGDVEVVRYRPLERECVNCHGAARDPLRRRRRR